MSTGTGCIGDLFYKNKPIFPTPTATCKLVFFLAAWLVRHGGFFFSFLLRVGRAAAPGLIYHLCLTCRELFACPPLSYRYNSADCASFTYSCTHHVAGYMHSMYTRVHAQVCTLVACVTTPTRTTGSGVARAVRVKEATPASAGRRQRATWQGRKAVCLCGACCRECCRDSGLSRHSDRWPGPSTVRWDVAAASYLQTNRIVGGTPPSRCREGNTQ